MLRILMLFVAVSAFLNISTSSSEADDTIIVCQSPQSTMELVKSFKARIGNVPEELKHMCGAIPLSILGAPSLLERYVTPHAVADIVEYQIPYGMDQGMILFRTTFGFMNFKPKVNLTTIVRAAYI